MEREALGPARRPQAATDESSDALAGGTELPDSGLGGAPAPPLAEPPVAGVPEGIHDPGGLDEAPAAEPAPFVDHLAEPEFLREVVPPGDAAAEAAPAPDPIAPVAPDPEPIVPSYGQETAEFDVESAGLADPSPVVPEPVPASEVPPVPGPHAADVVDEPAEPEAGVDEPPVEPAAPEMSRPAFLDEETQVHTIEPDVGPGEDPPPPPATAHPPEGQAGEESEEDVLEETPDFLQETPEHERLWFEQRPPRDFDFDK